MPIQVSVYEIVAVAVLGLAGYYWWLYRSGILKFSKANIPNETIINDDIIPRQSFRQNPLNMELPPSVDVDLEQEPDIIDDTGFEMLDNDDQVLLKEAEKIVEKIQDVINHIASDPPNPEEVSSKIRSILIPYKFLQETEYFDSINTYIALSLERDCGIALSQAELSAIWN